MAILYLNEDKGKWVEGVTYEEESVGASWGCCCRATGERPFSMRGESLRMEVYRVQDAPHYPDLNAKHTHTGNSQNGNGQNNENNYDPAVDAFKTAHSH